MSFRSFTSFSSRPYLFIQILISVFVLAVTMFAYIKKRNELTELSLVLPRIESDVKHLQRENLRLKYEIDSFENPIRMMEFARQPEFGHLKYPTIDEVIILKEGKDDFFE